MLYFVSLCLEAYEIDTKLILLMIICKTSVSAVDQQLFFMR